MNITDLKRNFYIQRLDEIALSEETIRANEAKCLAAKREKEAVEAQHNASKKEQEAKASYKSQPKLIRFHAQSL